MSLFSEDPIPPLPPLKSKPTAEEDRARQAVRLRMIRLRMAILFALDDRGITTIAGVGAAIGMSGIDAARLLNRKQWREGDVELLEAAAIRLGLQVPMPDPWRP
jgi:hypothetical protein